jgi:hypothetical protein
MNSIPHNVKENVSTEEVPVTVYLEKAPDLYFFGVMNTDEAGHLNVYTNGRLQENDAVVIRPHASEQEEGREEFTARVMSISPTSSPDYTYTYEYGIRYPG